MLTVFSLSSSNSTTPPCLIFCTLFPLYHSASFRNVLFLFIRLSVCISLLLPISWCNKFSHWKLKIQHFAFNLFLTPNSYKSVTLLLLTFCLFLTPLEALAVTTFCEFWTLWGTLLMDWKLVQWYILLIMHVISGLTVHNQEISLLTSVDGDTITRMCATAICWGLNSYTYVTTYNILPLYCLNSQLLSTINHPGIHSASACNRYPSYLITLMTQVWNAWEWDHQYAWNIQCLTLHAQNKMARQLPRLRQLKGMRVHNWGSTGQKRKKKWFKVTGNTQASKNIWGGSSRKMTVTCTIEIFLYLPKILSRFAASCCSCWLCSLLCSLSFSWNAVWNSNQKMCELATPWN